MADMWAYRKSLGDTGILWLDPDVAADPDDLAAMTEAVTEAPEVIHTAVLKLWPASTQHKDWFWSHRGGKVGAPAVTQDETTEVVYFAMGMVWLPARLLDLAFPAGRGWTLAQHDPELSELAVHNGIPARTVPGCRPKHLHFTQEHNDHNRQIATAHLRQLAAGPTAVA